MIAPPYYTEACSSDGGDCHKPHQGPDPLFLECYVQEPSYLGNGFCNDYLLTYSAILTVATAWSSSMLKGYYPRSFVKNLELIGNYIGDEALSYNSFDCGCDGGDYRKSILHDKVKPICSKEGSGRREMW